MPNFTNKAKLKKPLSTEYFNINDMNENMDKIEAEFYTPKYSEELLNEDITSFKVGTGKVAGVAKDYTEQMEQSLVTLADVQGKTIKSNNRITNIDLSTITNCTTDNKLPQSLSFVTYNNAQATFDRTSCTVTVTNTASSWYSNAETVIEGLEPNTSYLISAELSSLNNYASLDVFSDNIYQGYINLYKTSSVVALSNNAGKLKLKFYCTGGYGEAGNSTFSNISIKKIKQGLYNNLQLNSLDNGVNDYYSKGVYSKKISDVIKMSDLTWYASSTNGQNPNSTHYVYYAFPDNMKHDTNVLNSDTFITCSHLSYKPYAFTTTSAPDNNHPEYSTNCISGHTDRSELRIKIQKSIAPDLESLIDWINKNDVCGCYELKEYKSTYIDTSILCEKGDTLFIDTKVPLNCTHKVQFNTKAQVEELQEVVQNEKKSVWKKLKELTDFQASFGETGYFKFPTILGGLTVQWGVVNVTMHAQNWVAWDIYYPITFNKSVFNIIGNASNLNKASSEGDPFGYSFKYNVALMPKDTSRGKCEAYYVTGEQVRDIIIDVRWIAIGR